MTAMIVVNISIKCIIQQPSSNTNRDDKNKYNNNNNNDNNTGTIYTYYMHRPILRILYSNTAKWKVKKTIIVDSQQPNTKAIIDKYKHKNYYINTM